MSSKPQDQESKTNPAGWEEVGRQFQALGAGIASALRSAWEKEETRQGVQEARSGLSAMIGEIGQVIQETARSPEAQQMREEVGRAAESAVKAGEQTFEEVRPQLISALKSVNEELRKFLDEIDSKEEKQNL